MHLVSSNELDFWVKSLRPFKRNNLKTQTSTRFLRIFLFGSNSKHASSLITWTYDSTCIQKTTFACTYFG
jgi:hypothetical protein